MSKGSTPRPCDKKKIDENWEKIDWKHYDNTFCMRCKKFNNNCKCNE